MAYNKKDKDKLKAEIIEEISNGRSLKNILDSDNKMPTRTTVYEWLNDASDYYDEEFSNNYARATIERAEFVFDELFSIADDQENDVYIDDEGIERTNHNVINRSKLRLDTRKWVLSKMNPKKYGNQLDVTSGGDKLQINWHEKKTYDSDKETD